ncbi:winged helix-turn-helix transcriptional regulator [Streptomyces olivaceus]|uniref:winged helix-turn-helix transcriptional regulator n=2 Tax=Streptomyces TaxID=1883 RepID=UPI002DD8D8F2|nr:helix-turn-helix domain-containing protein [Streptomyces olivaceus]
MPGGRCLRGLGKGILHVQRRSRHVGPFALSERRRGPFLPEGSCVLHRDELTFDTPGYVQVTVSNGGKMERQTCPARPVLSRIGERWTMPICSQISQGVTRFSDIRAALSGVSAKVLSETLVRLERDGLVERWVVDDRPPSVTYHLTPLGLSLLRAVRTIVDWSSENTPRIEEARVNFDTQNQRPLQMARSVDG